MGTRRSDLGFAEVVAVSLSPAAEALDGALNRAGSRAATAVLASILGLLLHDIHI